MAALSDIIRWRDALQEARFTGIREVRDANGEVIVYKSDVEMASALAAADSAIDGAHRGTPIHTIQFNSSKGF